MNFFYQKDIGDSCALLEMIGEADGFDFCASVGAIRACFGIQMIIAVRVVPNFNIELFGVRSEHARSFCSLRLLVFCPRPHAAAEEIRTTLRTLVPRILSAKKGPEPESQKAGNPESPKEVGARLLAATLGVPLACE